ncbi:MAG: MBL fold hydrolase [Deltaproteobacteria bacterium]|jgi:glyoxylase-like metal-dependent hydrolase (beta-lactamase superfamily II)|nr:MAG: MBL fold hydrolase [Deltaproteobacteria bacterium]
MRINTIDLNFFTPNAVACYLVEAGSGPILIETGPDTTFPNLKGAIEGLGYDLRDIKGVFVTHIHLDHAGAAWHFASMGIRIYVHPFGAPHIVDPTRLLASARRIYKDQMELLWGRVEAISSEYVYAIKDGERVRLGGIEIEAVETLGHASHHHAYLIENSMFVGDIGGIRIEGGPVLPPTPPPDVHIEGWLESLRKIRKRRPEVIFLSHFGRYEDVFKHLDELERRLVEYSEWVGRKVEEGKEDEEIIPEFVSMCHRVLEEAGVDSSTVKAYEYADPFWMNVLGLTRYWKKFRLKL